MGTSDKMKYIESNLPCQSAPHRDCSGLYNLKFGNNTGDLQDNSSTEGLSCDEIQFVQQSRLGTWISS